MMLLATTMLKLQRMMDLVNMNPVQTAAENLGEMALCVMVHVDHVMMIGPVWVTVVRILQLVTMMTLQLPMMDIVNMNPVQIVVANLGVTALCVRVCVVLVGMTIHV